MGAIAAEMAQMTDVELDRLARAEFLDAVDAACCLLGTAGGGTCGYGELHGRLCNGGRLRYLPAFDIMGRRLLGGRRPFWVLRSAVPAEDRFMRAVLRQNRKLARIEAHALPLETRAPPRLVAAIARRAERILAERAIAQAAAQAADEALRQALAGSVAVGSGEGPSRRQGLRRPRPRAGVLVPFGLAFLFAGAGGCTIVDETEHCVKTRYGRVVQEKAPPGLDNAMFVEHTCFSMTEQAYPSDGEAEVMEAQTADPITVQGEVSVLFAYDPATIFNVFLEKRSENAVEIEILNAIREGYRNALAGWTVEDIFSSRRSLLGDSVKAHIQRKVGDRATVMQVFVRNISIPPAIEEARIAAARQAQVLDQARKQFQIDSVNAAARLMTANAEAQAKELTAAAYASNPALLSLDIAKAYAEGIARACGGSTSCVIGGSVMDTFRPAVVR